MKHTALSFLLLSAIAGCSSESEGDNAPSPGTTSAADPPSSAEESDEEPADSDELEEEASWTLSYSGDLSGEIGGTMIVVQGVPMMRSIQARGDGARLGMSISKRPGTDPPRYAVLPVTLTLEDGTSCKQADTPSVNVRELDQNVADVDVSGRLDCDGRNVTFETTIKKPRRR